MSKDSINYLFTNSRRRFLKASLAITSLELLSSYPIKIVASQDAQQNANEYIGEEILISAPQAPTTTLMDELWDLYSLIGSIWDMTSIRSIDNSRISFDDYITVKSTNTPSYTAEYENALQLYKQYSSLADLNTLLLEYIPTERPCITRISHMRKYVVREFALLHLFQGDFAWLGIKNYPGYAGGPITGHPYR